MDDSVSVVPFLVVVLLEMVVAWVSTPNFRAIKWAAACGWQLLTTPELTRRGPRCPSEG